MNGHISLITETWFKQSPQLEEVLTDIKHALGHECIRKDRSEGMGGGVAIVYKTGDLELQQIKLNMKYEIVAAIGRRTGQRKKVVVMAAYVPPNLMPRKVMPYLRK